ncbi:MAG: hypothetical protein WAT81_03780 [Candidatus Moraniibacteriota bacterium]
MKAFEIYQEAKKDHIDSPKDLEFVRSMFLQKAWADKKCAMLKVADESEREAAAIEWTQELGGWFRKNILEHETAIGQESRKQHFLELFDTNPEAALEELDALFIQPRH